MLVVKIELWPHGDKSQAKLLGRLDIANDGTGNSSWGNYITRLWYKNPTGKPLNDVWRFTHEPRYKWTVWNLVYRALSMYFLKDIQDHQDLTAHLKEHESAGYEDLVLASELSQTCPPQVRVISH